MGDDEVVVAFSINSNGVDQFYFSYYSFNSGQNWSPLYRVANLTSGPSGIVENGTTVSYDDTLSESALTVAYVGSKFVFAWEYNQTIVYRTWSTASASQTYSVSFIKDAALDFLIP